MACARPRERVRGQITTLALFLCAILHHTARQVSASFQFAYLHEYAPLTELGTIVTREKRPRELLSGMSGHEMAARLLSTRSRKASARIPALESRSRYHSRP